MFLAIVPFVSYFGLITLAKTLKSLLSSRGEMIVVIFSIMQVTSVNQFSSVAITPDFGKG